MSRLSLARALHLGPLATIPSQPLSELVEHCDAEHYAIEGSEPREVLRYLIEQRGLKQIDLAEIVPQGNLSAILAGKCNISAPLAGNLARHFNASGVTRFRLLTMPLDSIAS